MEYDEVADNCVHVCCCDVLRLMFQPVSVSFLFEEVSLLHSSFLSVIVLT